MIKKGIYISLLIAIFWVGFFLVNFSSEKLSEKVCNSYSIAILDSSEYSFVKKQELENLIKKEKDSIIGKKIHSINYNFIESLLESNSLIKQVECYVSPIGKLKIDVWQKNPILRVFTSCGSYYLDDKGEKTSLSRYSTADVIVASGNVNDSTTLRRLYDLAQYIDNDIFAKAMYEQIHVEKNGDFELVTRVGCQKIILGLPENLIDKMENLKTFYKRYLNDIGWQKYSIISMKFNGQIVCTLK